MTRSHNNNNGNSNKKAQGDTGRCGMSPIVMTVSGVFANVQTLIVHVKYGKKKNVSLRVFPRDVHPSVRVLGR